MCVGAAGLGPPFLPAPPPLNASRVALFLDLDGTLAEIEPRPDGVVADPGCIRALRALGERMPGRVVLLTGRTLEDADRILEGAVTPAAAVHGLVRRLADGTVAKFRPAPELEQARETLARLAKGQRGLILEEKEASVALHYRQNPALAEAVRDAAALVARSTGLTVQEGSMVAEVRTVGPDKGDSLRAFMAELPSEGLVPIAVGDDLTDEHAFAAAEALGGYGILVGSRRESRARYGLPCVASVLAWLEEAA
jgi:trehalose 6-phosphate phosphatase